MFYFKHFILAMQPWIKNAENVKHKKKCNLENEFRGDGEANGSCVVRLKIFESMFVIFFFKFVAIRKHRKRPKVAHTFTHTDSHICLHTRTNCDKNWQLLSTICTSVFHNKKLYCRTRVRTIVEALWLPKFDSSRGDVELFWFLSQRLRHEHLLALRNLRSLHR